MQMMCLPLSGDARMWMPGLQRKPVSRLSIRTGYLPLKSRGWVKLRSADPRDPPRIFLNMFSAEGDHRRHGPLDPPEPAYLRAEPAAAS